MTTDTGYRPVSIQTPFTDEEARALEAVRLRFDLDHDLLSTRERVHLCFLRWLVRSGRLAL